MKCTCGKSANFSFGDNANCPKHGAFIKHRRTRAQKLQERIDAVVAKAKDKEQEGALAGAEVDVVRINTSPRLKFGRRNRASKVG